MRIKMNNETQQRQQNRYSANRQLRESSSEEESSSCCCEEESGSSSSNNNNNNNSSSSSNKNNIDEITTSTERRNLEFALKLGYNDELVHTALQRLGAEAKQNDLLAELIKLSADAPKTNNATTAIPTRSMPLDGNLNFSSLTSSASSAAGQLRPIVIDGSNVALSHGNNEVFSCRGIRICVDWFRQRGHKEITAFVPNWRKETARTLGSHNIIEQELLYELERERVLVFTPSRLLDGKRVACYDDRYILKLAAETDGIVVSNDNYRDLLLENVEFRKVVQERLLMYSFVNDRFMPPDDPLGRTGPTLDVFLRMSTPKGDAGQMLCPYGKKCTYGNKCKFRHQTTATLLQQQHMPLTASHSAPLNYGNSCNGGNNTAASNILNKQTHTAAVPREPLSRTKSEKLANKPQVSYTLTPSTNTSTPSNWSPDEQLSTAFNYQLELQQHTAVGDELVNRHKKLQRQVPPQHQNGYAHAALSQPQPTTLHHRLVVPTISAPHTLHSNRHQNLARIPSAPTPALDNAHMHMLPAHNYAYLSASDSRIHEELHSAQSREEKRRLLRFHLSSLFPQHQVHAVLQMYPEETDAKTICAAIINLFPHN